MRNTNRVFSILLFLGTCMVSRLHGQTFVQLTQLGQGIGARLTRHVADSALDRDLFGSIGTKVTYVNFGEVFELATDPVWSRILSGKMGAWIHHFTGLTQAPLRTPMGIDITAVKKVYVADRLNGWILFADFDPNAENLVNPSVWSSPYFPRPVDVAWDGRTTPLTTQFMYVLDDSLSAVSYWDRGNPAFQWTYGSLGSGQGQFRRPSGVCVGKTVSGTGGTIFTSDFYVMDRGNRRIVWLRRGTGAPTWQGTFSLAAWDPTDCAVDHFGNLYVADESGHRIHKLTSSLALLATYGSYGKGQTNLNTFAFPHAISVPCGLKIANSQSVWYCEGRVITAELWSGTTGAVEHYLGVDASIQIQPQVTQGSLSAWFGYKVTDHATHSVEAIDWNGFHVRTLYPDGLTPPGSQVPYWDGTDDTGAPVPEGWYRFRVNALSAYGCSGQSWCEKNLTTESFLLDCPEWGCDQLRVDPGGTKTPAPTEPAEVFLRQRVVVDPRPLARVSDLEIRGPAEPTGVGSSLTQLVREFGIRGLTFGVPRSATSTPVTIRIYSMSGRLVRVLISERLDPGVYHVGWDGLDSHGQRAAPGVYVAHLSAGGKELIQRLILRHVP